MNHDDGENDDDSDNYNVDYEDDEDLPPQNGLYSSDDNADMRLIRTRPRVDSFDVEALEVNGAQRHDYEVHFYL